MKTLITGDIHIHDFRNFNLFTEPKFRLNQFDKLADRFIDIIEEKNVDTMFIAGDFFHVASPKPIVVNSGFSFLDKVSKYCSVYITQGQHDLDQRTGVSEENTLLSLCDRISNVRYCHKETVLLDGKRFYVIGWSPDWQDLVREMPKSDYLIGHNSPINPLIGQHNLRYEGGVDLEKNKKFKKAFLGDIHHAQEVGSCVIPGTPIQHSFNDMYDPSVVIFDTETEDIERVLTRVPGKFDFLELRITDEDYSHDPYTITRTKTTKKSKEVQTTLQKSLDILSITQDAVSQHELNDIHNEIMNSGKISVNQEVDLDFLIESVTVNNFRSVDDFHYEVPSGTTLFVGPNGSGKSSVLSAIMYGLNGSTSARSLVKIGKKNMSVELSIRYRGTSYKITRGWKSNKGFTVFEINDKEVESENQAKLKDIIKESLPFTELTDLFYFSQSRTGFLSSYNYSEQVNLISRLLGLKIVDSLAQEATQSLKTLQESYATIQREKAACEAVVAQKELIEDTVEIEEDVQAIQKMYDKLKVAAQTEKGRVDEQNQKKNSINSQLSIAVTELKTVTANLNSLKLKECYTCGQPIDEDKFIHLSENLMATHDDLSVRIIKLKDDLESALEGITYDKYNTLLKNAEEFGQKIAVCSEKKKQADRVKALIKSIEESQKKLSELEKTEENISGQMERYNQYIALMKPSGLVLRTLLELVSQVLSSENIQVSTVRHLVSGDARPDFRLSMRVGENFIDYDNLSGGQKTVADVYMISRLSHITGNIGALFLDETLKFLDETSLEITIETFKTMNVNSMFIVSHETNFPYYDTMLQFSILDGTTKIVEL